MKMTKETSCIKEEGVYELARQIDCLLQDNGILVKAAMEYHEKYDSLEAIKTVLTIRECIKQIRSKEY